MVRLTPELRAALATPTVRAVFVRGLEGAEAALAAEARGLAAAPGAAPEPRVSRVLLAANDGAERLYRQLERLVRVHAPRLMVCLVDAPAEELGGAIFGPGAAAKVALTSHKDAAARVLLALAASDVS